VDVLDRGKAIFFIRRPIAFDALGLKGQIGEIEPCGAEVRLYLKWRWRQLVEFECDKLGVLA